MAAGEGPIAPKGKSRASVPLINDGQKATGRGDTPATSAYVRGKGGGPGGTGQQSGDKP